MSGYPEIAETTIFSRKQLRNTPWKVAGKAVSPRGSWTVVEADGGRQVPRPWIIKRFQHSLYYTEFEKCLEYPEITQEQLILLETTKYPEVAGRRWASKSREAGR
jgi:hypothetical protein